ncbi:c-type cytochrome [Chitinophaga sedimenti]|uniref:c-type cytochrome n=1 Tax=Chitinophaga sedimenti TaxID=2033606 RepID=UPI00200327E7|nr:c-type cytochrome [Chitinophaga sedimenti]MCK7555976.1 c-type cytochrome [Chitinophaga sedimenti]
MKYAVSVSDKEDGSLANKRILPAMVSVSINYLSEGYDMTVIAQNQQRFDASAEHAAAKALLKKTDCNACHAMNAVSLGPSFMKIAEKYKNDKSAGARLTKKVINGGSGVWGDAMMPAHTTMSTTQVDALVKYILSVNEKKPAQKNLPVTGTYTTTEKPGQTNKGSYIFRAAYKDKGANAVPAQWAESILVLRHPNRPIAEADSTNGLEFNRNKSAAAIKAAKAWAMFKQTDLTDIKSITVSGSGGAGPDAVELRLGAPDGQVIGQAKTAAGEETVTVNLQPVSGPQDVYVVFASARGRVASITVNNK